MIYAIIRDKTSTHWVPIDQALAVVGESIYEVLGVIAAALGSALLQVRARDMTSLTSGAE